MDKLEYYLNKTGYTWNKNLSKEFCLTDSKEVITDCTNCYNLSERPLWQLYGHAIVIAMLILVSLAGNGLFLILFTKYEKLRYRSTIVSICVIFINTALIITFHFPVLITTVSRRWIFSFTGCQAFGFLTNDLFLTYWLTMGSLAFDRFFMIHFSWYPKRSKCILVSLILASWIAPILLSTVTVDKFSIVVFRQNVPTCIPYYPNNSKGRVLFFSIGILTTLTGGVIPSFLYIIIMLKAIKFLHRMKVVANNQIEGNTEPRPSEALQACDTLSLIFLVSCVTQIPSAFFIMIRWISLNAWCDIPHEIHFIATEILSSTTAIIPFVIMREKKFRRRIKPLLLCCSKHRRDRSACSERSRNDAAAKPVAEFNLVSFLPSEGQNHCTYGSDSYRSRSNSFPIAARNKVYASTASTNLDNFDEGNLGQGGKHDSLSPDLSPSSYGVEEVRTVIIQKL